MEMDNDKLREYVLFHVERKLINLYKSFLYILEDLKNGKYDIAQNQEIYQQTRKRVLDMGNDAIREINEHLEKLDISIRTKE